MQKKIAGIYNSNYKHAVGDGFNVVNIFPNGNNLGNRMSPFFMIDYQPEKFITPTEKKLGVNVHPHRGIEPVTIVYQGYIAHADGAGHSEVVGPGDIQWMTAGKGILHKEYLEENFTRQGGKLQMIQFWTILPTKYKFVVPDYQSIRSNDIKKAELPNNAGLVRVIAGTYENVSSQVRTYSPMNVLDVRLHTAGTIKISCPENYNMGLLVLTGTVSVNGQQADKEQFVLFENSGTNVAITATETAQLLILNGEPLNEPAVHKGPFVMNTEAEIEQAYADAKAGKFGFLKAEKVAV